MLSCHTSLPKGKNGYSTYCFLFLTLPLLSLLQVNVCIIFYRKHSEIFHTYLQTDFLSIVMYH